MMKEKNIEVFGSDVASNGGYLYSNTDRLSCKLSNGRMTQSIKKMLGDVTGKRIIDIGCGDGVYTRELVSLSPSYVLGVDANSAAINHAKEKSAHIKNINFEVVDIYDLQSTERFDVAVVRGILHHLYDVEKAITAISKVADQIIVVEPNGYNPILKVIEKVSPYHVQHEEKSYAPRNLDKWFKNNGCTIVESEYIGLVPIFSPDLLARVCKFFEPLVESIPLLRHVSCAQYVQKISTPSRTSR